MKTAAVIRFSWKNLVAHKLRMTLTVGGVAVGIAAIVFLVSFGFGLERLVTTQVADFSAFLIIDVPSISQRSGVINDQTIDKLKTIGHVESIERVTDLAGRVRLQSQNSTTETVVVGASPAYHALVGTTVTSGQLFTDDDTAAVIINQSLANLLGYENNESGAVGQDILLDLIIPKSLRELDNIEGAKVVEQVPFRVAGVFSEGQEPQLYMTLSALRSQQIVNSTSMKIVVDDKEAVPEIRSQIENLGFFTEYVGDTVNQITQVFGIFRIILGGFGAIALFVAALGAFNTLTISLMERMREVALLKMLGVRRIDVFKLFIAESLTIGLFGGIIGVLIGTGVGAGINATLNEIAQRAGVDAVSIIHTPIVMIVIVVIGSFLVGFLTGFYPSYRAIKTNPLDALRYE